jgi:hypothetical protein
MLLAEGKQVNNKVEKASTRSGMTEYVEEGRLCCTMRRCSGDARVVLLVFANPVQRRLRYPYRLHSRPTPSVKSVDIGFPFSAVNDGDEFRLQTTMSRSRTLGSHIRGRGEVRYGPLGETVWRSGG